MSKFLGFFLVYFFASSDFAIAGDLRSCPQFTKYGPPITINPSQNSGSRFICHKGFSLQYSAATKSALWVAEFLRGDKLVGAPQPELNFVPEPAVPKAERSLPSDYIDSGYILRQYAPSADFKTDAAARSASFYLSNAGPQVKPTHPGVWVEIERYVRKLASKRKNGLYVVTGPVYDLKDGLYVVSEKSSQCPSASVDKQCKDVFVKKATIGSSKIFVPNAYYKVVLDPEAGKAIAFVVPNAELLTAPDIKKWLRNVREVETLTQLDFHSALDRKLRDKIETETPVLWSK